MRISRLTTGSTFTRSGIRLGLVQVEKIEVIKRHPDLSAARDLVALTLATSGIPRLRSE